LQFRKQVLSTSASFAICISFLSWDRITFATANNITRWLIRPARIFAVMECWKPTNAMMVIWSMEMDAHLLALSKLDTTVPLSMEKPNASTTRSLQ
jgi:hypothetical protein